MQDLETVVKHEVQEALGPDNKWYCSNKYGYEVTDPDKLLTYYIKAGGAKNYRDRITAKSASCCSCSA